jgi:hypothetical protein
MRPPSPRGYRLLTVVASVTLSACASSNTTFVSSWKSPDTPPIDVRGAKVAAVVMMRDQASRRTAEDALARELTARGATGIAMYTLLPDVAPDEATARAALEQAGVQGVVVMRPLAVEKETELATVTLSGGQYGGLWGRGYWGRGWGTAYVTPGATNTIVSVETLVYSLKQNKLLWSGRSKTTNPENVDNLVKEVSAATAREMKKQRLIAG